MKYTLLIALFAGLALASAFPSDTAETAKAEGTAEMAEKTAEVAAKAEETMAETKDAAAPDNPVMLADDADSCEPGASFKNDCNDCTCPPSGLRSKAACTLKLCLGSEPLA